MMRELTHFKIAINSLEEKEFTQKNRSEFKS